MTSYNHIGIANSCRIEIPIPIPIQDRKQAFEV